MKLRRITFRGRTLLGVLLLVAGGAAMAGELINGIAGAAIIGMAIVAFPGAITAAVGVLGTYAAAGSVAWSSFIITDVVAGATGVLAGGLITEYLLGGKNNASTNSSNATAGISVTLETNVKRPNPDPQRFEYPTPNHLDVVAKARYTPDFKTNRQAPLSGFEGIIIDTGAQFNCNPCAPASVSYCEGQGCGAGATGPKVNATYTAQYNASPADTGPEGSVKVFQAWGWTVWKTSEFVGCNESYATMPDGSCLLLGGATPKKNNTPCQLIRDAQGNFVSDPANPKCARDSAGNGVSCVGTICTAHFGGAKAEFQGNADGGATVKVYTPPASGSGAGTTTTTEYGPNPGTGQRGLPVRSVTTTGGDGTTTGGGSGTGGAGTGTGGSGSGTGSGTSGTGTGGGSCGGTGQVACSVNFGGDPGIAAPGAGGASAPGASAVGGPLGSLTQSIKDWAAPARSVICPTWRLNVNTSAFHVDQTIDSHCDFAEQNRALIASFCVVAYSLIAFFKVLEA